MSDRDHSLLRLRRANPAPTRPVEHKPTAQEMLAAVQQRSTPRRAPQPKAPQQWRRGLVVAAAVFAAVILMTVPIVLFLTQGYEDAPVTTDPSVSTTAPATTTPPTTVPPTTAPPTTVPGTTVPTTAAPGVLDPATQQLVSTFVATYNAGDVGAFMAFLHPDFRRETGIGQSQPPETVLTLFEVDAALKTEITLECLPGAADAVCSPSRFDNLHRALGIPPSAVTTWFLTFEEGLLRTWSETTPFGPTPYSTEAVTPFADWVAANTLLNPRTFEQQYFSGGSGTWVPRDGIADDVATLVTEWADSLGVTLEN